MRRASLLLVSSLAVVLSGCASSTTPRITPASPALPEYDACVSTELVDPGNASEPVITLTGRRVVALSYGATYNDAGATATDPHDGDISSKIEVNGLSSVNTRIIGDYLIRYNVKNSAGLRAREAVRIIRVNAGSFAKLSARDMGTTSAHMAYYEHLPVHYSDDPNAKYPLIIFIHGWGHARFVDPYTPQVPLSNLENIYFPRLINGSSGTWDDTRPFIVLSPQKCTDDLIYGVTAYRMKLFIDYAMNTYQVDSSRIYMGGHSQGSGDAWDYVTNYQHQLAAIFPISGGYGTVSGCALKDTPAWAFAGELDKPVDSDQVNTVTSINNCNPPERAKVTVFAGEDHNSSVEAVLSLSGLGHGKVPYDLYDQSIYDWMLAHERK